MKKRRTRVRASFRDTELDQAESSAQNLLEIRDLAVEILNRKQVAHVLRGVSLAIETGEMHGLVGETGSGKSMTAYAVMDLLPKGGYISSGSIKLAGRELVGLGDKAMRDIRGPQIGMIFQNPRTALYPLLSIDSQMNNMIGAHRSLSKRIRKERVREYLTLAGIPDAERVARAYPHELSGGMAQRVVIASALISEPILLIADEPTTGLDVTVQRQILEELAGLQRRLHLSTMMITHDLAIIAQYCDSVSVMHEGLIVEHGSKQQVLANPTHSYTRRLIEASKLEDIRKASATI